MAMNMMKSMPGFDEIINDKDKFRERCSRRGSRGWIEGGTGRSEGCGKAAKSLWVA